MTAQALTQGLLPRNPLEAQRPDAGGRDMAGRLPLPVVLYLLAVVLPVTFPLGPLMMTGVRLILIVLVVPLAVRLLMRRYGPILPVDILFALHILWVLVALGVNNPGQMISNAGSTGVEFLGGCLLGRAYVRDRATFIALVRFLLLLICLLMPFAVYEALTGRAVLLDLLRSLPGVGSLADISTDKRLGLNRVQAVFAHPIHFGLFCTISFSLCFVGLKGVMNDAMRLLVSAVVGLCALLSLSSGAFLAVLLQLFLITWAWIFAANPRRWLILLAVLAVAYVAVDLASNRTPIRVFMSYATFSPHTAYWRGIIFEWGMKNVWANPVFGLGLNDWVRPVYMRSGSMDNFWLVMAVRYGIPGFALLAAGYLLVLWRVGRRQFDGDPLLLNLRRAWMFSFVGLTFTLCTVHIWHTIYSFVFFVFGAGIWFLQAEPRRAGDGTAEGTAAAAERRAGAIRTGRPHEGRPNGGRPRAGAVPSGPAWSEGAGPAGQGRRAGQNAGQRGDGPRFSRFAGGRRARLRPGDPPGPDGRT